jgi:competence protein ComEA
MPPTPKSATVKPATVKPPEANKPSEKPVQAAQVRWHWASALAGALIAAILLGAATFLWRRPVPPPIAIHAPPTPVIPTAEPTATAAPLVVFVSGAVQTPGVYELPPGARVVDLLARAGGFTPDANVVAVNQAMPLRDGDQLHVPTLAEEPATPQAGLTNPTSPGGSGGLININTATAEELQQLPGIGPSRAEDIIANRPYETVDDLDRVPGIGAGTIENVRPYVVVD